MKDVNVFILVEVVRMNGECSEEDTETAITKDEQNTEKEEKNGEKEEKDDSKDEDKDEDKDQEVVLIQDTGFNVKIIVPGIDEFELPVSKLSQCKKLTLAVIFHCMQISFYPDKV